MNYSNNFNNKQYNTKDNSSANLYSQYNQASYTDTDIHSKGSSIKKTMITAIVVVSIFSLIVGLAGGFIGSLYYKNAQEALKNAGAAVIQPKPSLNNIDNSSQPQVYTNSDLQKKYDSVAQIYEDTVDAVVGIAVEISGGSGWNAFASTSFGSGVIISEDGYIITNNHVINNATRITVHLGEDEIYEAAIVGSDVQLDIALLKIDAKNLHFLTMGDSSQTSIGNMVLVIGNPLGYLNRSLTVGYISGIQREITLDNEKMSLIQTDAAVNPGNSGGAMIDTSGRLIGIINAKSYGNDIDGIGFAIPINDVKNILDDIVNYGYVTGRPYLGVSLGEINSQNSLDWYNMMYKLELTRLGVYIGTVEEGSAADKAGLKQWDCVVSFDGVDIKEALQFKSLIEESKVGQIAEIVVQRGSELITLTVVIGEMTPKG